jgi:hypothetical protein
MGLRKYSPPMKVSKPAKVYDPAFDAILSSMLEPTRTAPPAAPLSVSRVAENFHQIHNQQTGALVFQGSRNDCWSFMGW